MITVTISENVKSGSTGNTVKLLQTLLIGAGFACGGVDGIAGTRTINAVKKYQTAKGLTVDGIAGQNTFTALMYGSK